MRIGIIRDVSEVDRKTEAARKSEREFQEESVKAIEKVLRDDYDVIDYVFDDTVIDKLREDKIDLVFNLAHGKDQVEDLTELPTLLNQADIPYIGSNALGHGVAVDKALTAAILERNGISHPETAKASNPVELAGIDVAYPVVVKPNYNGASRGVTEGSLVRDGEELFKESTRLFGKGATILLSHYIDGKEVTVGIIGNGKDKKVLTPVEIDFSESGDGEALLTFEAKERDLVDYHVPARLSDGEKKAVQETAEKVFDLLQIRDYGSIDLRIKDGKAYVLEMNSLAGLQPETSDLVKSAEGSDLDYDALIKGIVEAAIAREGLEDQGKEGDLDELIQKRRRENEAAHAAAVEAFRERADQKAKRKIEDAEDEVKRKSREYKDAAQDKTDALKSRAEEAGEEAKSRAEEAGEEVKSRAEEAKDKAERQGRELKDSAKDAARKAQEAGAPRGVLGAGEAGATAQGGRYEALEKRVHALEERLRILESHLD